MFDRNDFMQIDKEYFQVLAETGYHIMLESQNTGHIWDIYCQEHYRGRSLVISHKHSDTEPFHIQRKYHLKTVMDAQKKIMKHDNWYLKGQELS